MFSISFENLCIPRHFKDLNGTLLPSPITAIIGEGKDEFLRALGGCSKLNITGKIMVNGINIDKNKYFYSFISQRDHHYPTMTIREMFKMISSLKEEKDSEVDDLIQLFDLSSVEDQKIKNISNFHLKLVSIAIEFLTKSKIIFLESPFHALEEKEIIKIIKILSNYPCGNIILTVDDIRLLEYFEKIILLNDGKILFSGSFKEFKDDYSLNIYKEDVGLHMKGEIDAIKYLFLEKIPSKTLTNVRRELPPTPLQQVHPLPPLKQYPPLWIQFKVLLKRNTLNIVRRPLYLLMMAIETIILGLVIGFVGLDEDDTVPRIKIIFNRVGALVFFSITSFSIGIIGVLSIFSVEKDIIKKEMGPHFKLYGPFMYLITKIISDLPIQLLVPYIFVLIAYYIVGLNPEFSAYLMMGTLAAINALCGSAYGMAMAQLCNGDLFLVFELSPLVITPFNLVIFIITIPDYLVWIKYISPIYYCMSGLLQVEFSRSEPIPCDSNIEECSLNSEFISYYWVFSSGVDLVFLFTIYFVLISLTYFCLFLRSTRRI